MAGTGFNATLTNRATANQRSRYRWIFVRKDACKHESVTYEFNSTL